MKVLLVSGFLGAGKTTFIRELASHSGPDIAIMENEFGAAGLDGDLLKRELTQAEIWELTEGCACCTQKESFTESVLTIANTLDPECLIVEPTGVAYLSNLIRNLMRIQYERIVLLKPLVIVDGRSIGRCMQEYPEIFDDQVRSAGTVLLSKLENAQPEERLQAEALVHKIAPEVPVLTEHYSLQPQEFWDRLWQQAYDQSLITVPAKEEAILPETRVITRPVLPAAGDVVFLMEDIIRGTYGGVIRAKGVIFAEDTGWLRFELADSAYSLLTVDDPGPWQAVFLGRGIYDIPLPAAPKKKDNSKRPSR